MIIFNSTILLIKLNSFKLECYINTKVSELYKNPSLFTFITEHKDTLRKQVIRKPLNSIRMNRNM